MIRSSDVGITSETVLKTPSYNDIEQYVWLLLTSEKIIPIPSTRGNRNVIQISDLDDFFS